MCSRKKKYRENFVGRETVEMESTGLKFEDGAKLGLKGRFASLNVHGKNGRKCMCLFVYLGTCTWEGSTLRRIPKARATSHLVKFEDNEGPTTRNYNGTMRAMTA